jgi:hypothetical protein
VGRRHARGRGDSTSSPHSRRYAWTSAAARGFLLGVWRDGLSGALQMGPDTAGGVSAAAGR